MGRLQKALATRGPTSFGGLFIDYVPEYRITLLALPGGADEVIRAVDELGFGELSSFAITRETPYTEDVLKDAMRMVADLGGAKVTGLDLDIRTGEIVATTAVDAADPPVPARRVVVREAVGGGNQPGGAIAKDSAISVHPLGSASEIKPCCESVALEQRGDSLGYSNARRARRGSGWVA